MVAHELTHGMGFSSLLVEYTSGDVSYLAPQIFNLENKRTSGRIPVSVFDGLLPIPKFFHDISLVPTEKDKFVETLEANDDLMLSVNDFYALVTSDSLYATVSGDRIRLHSPTNYKKGVSITHLHLSFADTSDFLMVSGTQSTTSMAQFYNDGPIYGPNTLKIFKGLGYATKNDPTVIKLLNI